VVNASGDVRQLCVVTQPTNISWGAGDEILFAHRDGISMVDGSGGTCRLVLPRGDKPIPRVAFLPDAKRFVYSQGRTGDLVVADHDGRTLGTFPVRPSTFAVVEPNYLVYQNAADGRAIDIRPFDTRSLAWSGPAVRLLNGVRSRGGVNTFSISANGALAYLPGSVDRAYFVLDRNRLADTVPLEGAWTVSPLKRGTGAPTIAIAGNLVGLWLYDLEGKRVTRVALHDTTIVSNTLNSIGATYPTFSADGKQIAYAANRHTECGISVHDLAVDSDRVVIRAPMLSSIGFSCLAPMDWFPDGKRLLVRRDTSLQIMGLDGSVAADISRPGTIWEGHLSPDGTRVAYASDETSRAEVYVQSLPSGLPTRVSLDGGRWPGWSDDGKALYFMTPDGRVQKAMLNGTTLVGAATTVLNAPMWRRNTFDDFGVGFAVVGDGEYFIVRPSPTALGVAYIQNWRSLVLH